ncbi:hypothetical protein FHL15_002273 [Xylaria flabelliformis]|uniref:Uncharacterized protein n=1 Tax=Xylaria flabelliformis TaxID=2512241 RepID=A0A553I9V5_9PEZI|nr:hypothetical protein FHL15_002273 [Xylaria flabelliformis]
MAELISLTDFPSILPPIDPIYIGLSASPALPTAGIRAILRRTKSMGCDSNLQDFQRTVVLGQSDEQVRYPRGRTKSPVYVFHLDSTDDYQNSSSCAISRSRSQSETTSSQRSPSRGRTRRRDATPYPCHPRREKSREHNKGRNVSRPRKHIPSQSPPSGQVDLSSPSNANGPIPDVSSYITKGVFRLYNYRGPELFRFPKSRSQPEPSWRAGDGFSDDEATPNFVFLMTGKHKRKRSRSLSAFGQLSIQAENDVEATSGQACLKKSHRSRGKVRSTIVREVWPTRENFAESTINRKPRNITAESHGFTSPLNSERETVSKSDMKQVVPLKRMASGFENLGKGKRRFQSNQDENPPMLFTRFLPEYEDQTGDGEYEEEGDQQDAQMEDECQYESDVFEYAYTPAEVEGGFQKLDENSPDNFYEDMQDTVPDSQMEVPSSSCGLGQGLINKAHAITMTQWASVLLNPGINLS